MSKPLPPGPKRWVSDVHKGRARTCHICGQAGHVKRQCPLATEKDNACFYCGSLDHVAKACPMQQQRCQQRPQGASAAKAALICTKCGGAHDVVNCYWGGSKYGAHCIRQVVRSPAAAAASGDGGDGIPQQLSVLITTSPVPSNPLTDMLEQVIASLATVPQLAACPLVLVCDGYKAAKASTWKAGRVDDMGAAAYDEYVAQLQALVEAGDARLGAAPVTLLLLEGRHGQALAVKAGLEHVATELVLVHQHDILFMVSFDLRTVCAALRGGSKHPVRYVGMPLLTNVNYEMTTMQRHRVKVAPVTTDVEVEVTPGGGSGATEMRRLELMPIIFWYDSTHLTSVKHYRELVFSRSNLFRRGDFMEETFGCKQRRDIMEHGMDAHAKYGTYHLMAHAPGSRSRVPVICHMNGNRYLTAEQRAAKFGCDTSKISVAAQHPSRVMTSTKERKLKGILRMIIVFAGAVHSSAEDLQSMRQCLSERLNMARGT